MNNPINSGEDNINSIYEAPSLHKICAYAGVLALNGTWLGLIVNKGINSTGEMALTGFASLLTIINGTFLYINSKEAYIASRISSSPSDISD